MTVPPTVSVVTIGTELVLGELPNDNAVWLCGSLTSLGLTVRTAVAVPDDVDEIADRVRHERAAADIVLTSGGLGGTPDDVTRAGIARAFGVAEREDPVLAAELRAARPGSGSATS